MGKVKYYAPITGMIKIVPSENLEEIYIPAADYQALEAENDELKQEIKDRAYSEKCVTITLHDALDERDELQAKLAALVGAGGLAINAIEALNAVLEPDSNEGVQVAWNMTFRARDRLNAAIAAADYRALERKLAALVKAGNVLLKKLKLVHDSAEYEAVWHISQSHVGPYKGPTYIDEMDTLKAAIAAAEGKAKTACK